ncbi:acyltransferase ChoActase/COT/CPT [Kockovaella imperatae]|uniref:Acyltransferase ChoActase/COT/CPT n=1 Tax=Kockovaella imperatae TaxID=4999 RepID=A0A1Y1UGG5_9TREE|nr:acyltransferase ChoActase/COT/CPT [Kockovaella imperatae]ORX36165.1 acyltransferase ChoActase/COT/CPT [Kockovaella imperatae]
MSSTEPPTSGMIPSNSSQTPAPQPTKPKLNGDPKKLPKLPVPKLEDTCKRYLRALKGLQDEEEHHRTEVAVNEFLTHGEGEYWQKKLLEYNEGVDSYIEEFWYESYLSHAESVVLSLNPFFVLSSDVTPRVNPQLSRAASLILSSLSFIHDLRNGLLTPDSVRGTPLDMSQYERLFGACRVPTDRGCRMEVHDDSRHIVVIRRGQFYWFDCLDSHYRPLQSDKEIFNNLEAIVRDADKTPVLQVAQNAMGLLTTESRKVWSHLREELIKSNKNNANCLSVVESALFIVCLDDDGPEDLAELCGNFLCGGYKLDGGVQVGTCTNRWYDKLQIIVCDNGEAGINFEHTGVDGHTVLRYAADVYTELVLLFAKTINPSTPSLFKARFSPLARASKAKAESNEEEDVDISPKKLEWRLTPEIKAGVRYAETRISDLICQNDSQAMEFRGYGGTFIKRHGFSPDAFVQMAFQAAYYGLYGRVESTYEPAMTKAFLHGRTEAIRTVQPESVTFVKTFCSESASTQEKVKTLRDACKRHTQLTKECSQGLGQDRHLYAMRSLIQKEAQRQSNGSSGDSHANGTSGVKVPAIFTDPGYGLLGTSVLSTSNCGNPALRLFGFGPVTPEGYGIGYIIKDEGISICVSSKHLQGRRFLATIQAYLLEIRGMLVQLWKEANEAPEAFMDHTGILRDARTGKPIESVDEEEKEKEGEEMMGGFGFFDVGAQSVAPQARRRRPQVGKVLSIAEY